MRALSEQDQQQLQAHLEVYYLACPISNAPVESLLQLLKHGTGLPTPPAEQQGSGVRAELDTSSTRKRRAGGRDRTQQVEQDAVEEETQAPRFPRAECSRYAAELDERVYHPPKLTDDATQCVPDATLRLRASTPAVRVLCLSVSAGAGGSGQQVVAEVNKRMTMGSKQCVLAAVLCLAVLLLSFLAPTQLPPPVQLNIWEPQLFVQIRDAMELLTKASVLEHLMRGPHHRGIRLLPGEVAVFEQPSSAWPVAMLKQLDEEHLLGDNNTLNANATTIINSIQEFYRHPGRFISWWCKAVGVVEGGFMGVRARHFVIDDRMLHGLLTDLGMTDLTRRQFQADNLPHWQQFIQYSQLQISGWEFARRVKTDGPGTARHFVTEPVELPFIGRKLTATSDYDPATHIAVGVDPGVTQAIKAGHAQRHLVTGQVLRQWEWELSKGQLKHDSGLTKAKQDTARWSTAIQPQLQQLAASTPAGTTLDSLQTHILALKATWDALWEEYLRPRWRRPRWRRLGLHHAQERVIEAFCKEDPPAPAQAPPPPPAQGPPAQTPPPPPAQAQPLPAAPGPVPPPQALPGGRLLDRDTNGCLNLQRIGESKQRPIELCQWADLKALPAIGKEYQQRYKLVNDRLPKGRQCWLGYNGWRKELGRACKAKQAAEPTEPSNGPGPGKGKAAWATPTGRGIAEMREFVFNPATQIGVGIDPGVTQAVSAASGLTKGEVKHASGLNNARRDTERWLAPIKPHLQHLAAASSAGTSLKANLKHITVTLATWDAVWEVYLDPKWARQRLRLYGAQDRALEQFFNKLEEGMAELSMKRHNRAKQLVVFFGAASIGTRGGVVLVDEHRTSRVSSAVNGKQPCEVELNTLSATRPAGWKPPAGQVHHRLVRPAWSQERGQPVRGLVWCPVVAPRRPPQAPRSGQAATQPAASEPGPSTPLPAKRSKRTKAEPEAAEPTKAKGKAVKAKPAPQPGKWLDRDCNAALNMQRIGESRWRPLELCYWPDQGALPAKGKEYPGLGYKRLRDKPPKAQQQQPAEAQ
ncbi:hypothetical protein QJQ45_004465 [Haematococcus lacustris]|nr:hypothetical protein QJQ45_004465 [Haematococcus lacustris]